MLMRQRSQRPDQEHRRKHEQGDSKEEQVLLPDCQLVQTVKHQEVQRHLVLLLVDQNLTQLY